VVDKLSNNWILTYFMIGNITNIHFSNKIKYIWSVQRENAPRTDQNWFPHAIPCHKGTGFDSKETWEEYAESAGSLTGQSIVCKCLVAIFDEFIISLCSVFPFKGNMIYFNPVNSDCYGFFGRS